MIFATKPDHLNVISGPLGPQAKGENHLPHLPSDHTAAVGAHTQSNCSQRVSIIEGQGPTPPHEAGVGSRRSQHIVLWNDDSL